VTLKEVNMSVIQTTDQEFKQLIQDHSKVVVKYFAGWCGSCRLMAPKFKKLANDERFEGIAFLDVDAEKNPEARALAGVDNLPFFATFENGQLKEAGPTAKIEKVEEMIAALN
jgi:thiol-disulfide isomerase/thioredoxin